MWKNLASIYSRVILSVAKNLRALKDDNLTAVTLSGTQWSRTHRAMRQHWGIISPSPTVRQISVYQPKRINGMLYFIIAKEKNIDKSVFIR